MANNEGVDIIIKATDQYTATINKIAASNKLFGQSVENTQKQVSALEKYMVTLVSNGIDPADAKIVQLKNDYDKLSQSLNSGQGALKSSSKQWTSLALVVQDLPYGFRGIQNNLPALFGSIASAAGPAYFAFSALIAAITYFDQQSSKAAASTKSLYEGFNKLKTETLSLGSIFSAVREGTLSAADATKIFNEELGDLYGTAKNVYEAEQLYIKKTEGYIKAQYFRAKADIEYEKAKEALAKKDAAYAEDQVGILGRLATATAAFFKTGAFQGIGGLYSTATLYAKESAAQQVELAGYVTDYEEAQFQKRLALGQKYMSQAYKIEQQYGIKSTTIKDKTDKAALAALGKAIEQQQRVNEKVLQDLIDAKKQEVKMVEDDAYKKYEVSKELAELERQLGLEKIKNGEYTTKQQLALEEGLNREYANKLILLDQQTQEQILEQNKKFTDKKRKNKEEELKNAISFAKRQTDIIKTQSDVEQKLFRGNLEQRRNAIKDNMAKVAILAASTFNPEVLAIYLDMFNKLNAQLTGLGDNWDVTANKIRNLINDVLINSVASLGESLGKFLAGEKVQPFVALAEILASALVDLGKSLISFAILEGAALEALKNPAKWKLALAAGIAAVAAGSFLKAKLGKDKTQKFANGGIISGPTMGLMGEYPGAASNPEVVAPLDKLQSLIGNTGGTLEARISGNDLLILMNKANRNNQNTF